MNAARLPVYEPWVTEQDALRVSRAVTDGLLSGQAPNVGEFEDRFASYVGMPHAAAVSSGTLALELAVRALGLGPGDEVLCPAFCIVACAHAIVAAGATPVLVDARADDYNLDLELAAARVTSKTRAILVVHTYGNPIRPDDLVAFASRHGLLVLEDAAEAHGAEAELGGNFRRCGSFGDVSIFSFYANKAITCGEGGMVLARSAEVAERVKSLRNLGFGRERRYVHDMLGTSARLSGVQAALGLSQLERIDQIIALKRDVAAAYAARLSRLPYIDLPHAARGTRPVPWMVGLCLSDSVPFDAAELGVRLAARGIETRPFFTGMNEQPALLSLGLFAGEAYPVAERISRRGLYLPSSPKLTPPDIERVCEAVEKSRS